MGAASRFGTAVEEPSVAAVPDCRPEAGFLFPGAAEELAGGCVDAFRFCCCVAGSSVQVAYAKNLRLNLDNRYTFQPVNSDKRSAAVWQGPLPRQPV